MVDIFLDKIDNTGNFAGVFEANEEVGYFYLYKIKNQPTQRIVGALQVLIGPPDFTTEEADIQWFENGSKVGFFIRKELWAYFDLKSGQGNSGSYPKAPLSWSSQ
uniref:Uncharacterized protein n=1 Tax=uncultured bacterium Bio2 TaxID=460936 RepID=B2BKA0_9BACT|nr:unknown [uncultured bacterium Bio2]